MMMTTLHSIERAQERRNLKTKRAAVKNIQLALERGKRAEDCTSWERAYLQNEARDNSIAIAYNGFCYIVGESRVCVTLYALPSWFGKKKHFNGKERIRDYKKYCKGNGFYNEKYLLN